MARINYSKYRAQKIRTANDGVFDSKAEFRHWMKLKTFERKGWIKDLRRQVEYVLIPAQYRNGKCVEKAVKYVADFVYVNEGIEVVEDVKGYKTPEYVIKRKLMLYVHGIKIQEVKVS